MADRVQCSQDCLSDACDRVTEGYGLAVIVDFEDEVISDPVVVGVGEVEGVSSGGGAVYWAERRREGER